MLLYIMASRTVIFILFLHAIIPAGVSASAAPPRSPESTPHESEPCNPDTFSNRSRHPYSGPPPPQIAGTPGSPPVPCCV